MDHRTNGDALEAGGSSRWARLVALLAFTVPAVFFPWNVLAPGLTPAVNVGRLVFLLMLVGLFVVGLAKGLPRWSLPYLGFVLAVLWMLAWTAIRSIWLERWMVPWMHRIIRPGDLTSRLLWQAIQSGIFWVGLLATIALCTLSLAAWPAARGLYQRIVGDRTLLPFVLYGAVPLELFFTFDDYTREEPYVLTGVVLLALGAWLYLGSSRPRRRLLALLTGVALAIAVAALGKWMIVPVQDWPVWFQWHPLEGERWFEAWRTAIAGGWAMAVMMVSLLLVWPTRWAGKSQAT